MRSPAESELLRLPARAREMEREKERSPSPAPPFFSLFLVFSPSPSPLSAVHLPSSITVESTARRTYLPLHSTRALLSCPKILTHLPHRIIGSVVLPLDFPPLSFSPPLAPAPCSSTWQTRSMRRALCSPLGLRGEESSSSRW